MEATGLEKPDHILEIHDLHTSFETESGTVRAVNGVDLKIPRGQIVGLVGESGCGKSVLARSIMSLLRYPGHIESGSILFDGQELVGMEARSFQTICGRDITMVFQEPMTSLNPVLRVGRQVAEALLVHKRVGSKIEAKQRVIEMFARVGIPEPEQRFTSYPHELSGGLRQRVMIAMAMICEPKLLIADEPTTALDVTIEAQILQLIRRLCLEEGMSVLIITHNMGVVAEICDLVYVMYAGQIMEYAPVNELFDHTMHPYTKGLLASIPRIGENPEYLHTIPGTVPNLIDPAPGCVFADRCTYATELCRSSQPSMYQVGEPDLSAHACRCTLVHSGDGSSV